jgi:tryptophan halogenase
LTAAYLARVLGALQTQAVQIELVESPEIASIGVGEGTFPSIKGALSTIGISEARFLRETHGTFKQGVKFVHWVRPPGAAGADHYFHPFSLPSQRPGGTELLPYWLAGHAGEGASFAASSTLQKHVVDARRGPKQAHDRDYHGSLNYAYHFDAARFAQLLAQQAGSLGVTRRTATIGQVELDERGHIAAVHTADGQVLRADLYIDCTGFHALLIGRALGSPWRSVADQLFVDRALAVQVPDARPGSPLASATISTAHEAGWTWDIALQDRRGIGYVYSSRHGSEADAEAVLRRYIGPALDTLNPRLLKLQIGYREHQWVGNCVAVGLSAGFLEPLESSGIGLIETAAYMIAHRFPFDGLFDDTAASFNTMMRGRFERIVDFIKLHYAITQRRDSAFWVDNADPASHSESLRALLRMWRHRPPHRLDFIADLEMYLTASWQYVLYGMEYPTQLNVQARAALDRVDDARREFAMLNEVAALAVRDLPDHRALITQLCARTA